MKGEVETQFLLSGLLLHTQPLHSSEHHTRAHLEFSSHFDSVNGPLLSLELQNLLHFMLVLLLLLAKLPQLPACFLLCSALAQQLFLHAKTVVALHFFLISLLPRI